MAPLHVATLTVQRKLPKYEPWVDPTISILILTSAVYSISFQYEPWVAETLEGNSSHWSTYLFTPMCALTAYIWGGGGGKEGVA